MNDEIKEILEDLRNKNISVDDLTHNDKTKLLDYITNLEQKVEQYENPDDYTLFYMWLDAKAKDKMKQLQEEKEDYKSRCEKAIDKMSKLKPFIPNEIPSWLDELENILNGGDE